MSMREYPSPNGGKHTIKITSDGTDVRVQVLTHDPDNNKYGAMIDMPITELSEMFKEADEEERVRRIKKGGKPFFFFFDHVHQNIYQADKVIYSRCKTKSA